MKNILILILFAFAVTNCREREYIDVPLESGIVVEGSIEEGGYAQVILSYSVPVSVKVDSSNFLKYVIRSAMVIVSNDTESDTLALMISENNIPPFAYRGSKIRGEAGKAYSLTVKYLGKVITAETTVPKSVKIETVSYNKNNAADTTGTLSLSFNDPKGENNYYRIMTKLHGYDDIFVPAFYGNLSDENFVAPNIRLQVTRGVTIFPKTNLKPHFNDGDVISVKLCTVEKEGFDFWNSWQNEIINTQNPIFPANSNLKTNIKGGMGIWCGYGESTKVITAQ